MFRFKEKEKFLLQEFPSIRNENFILFFVLELKANLFHILQLKIFFPRQRESNSMSERKKRGEIWIIQFRAWQGNTKEANDGIQQLLSSPSRRIYVRSMESHSQLKELIIDLRAESRVLAWQDAELLKTELGNTRLRFLLVVCSRGTSIIDSI